MNQSPSQSPLHAILVMGTIVKAYCVNSLMSVLSLSIEIVKIPINKQLQCQNLFSFKYYTSRTHVRILVILATFD